MTAITIPENLWDEDEPGVIANWLFDDGDSVSEGTVVAEVMKEKTSFDIAAPATGKLVIEMAIDAEVTRGQRIGSIAGA